MAAAELKRPTGWVAARQQLLLLCDEVQQLASVGLIAMCHVKTLVKLSPEQQRADAEQMAAVKRKFGKTASLKHLDPRCRRRFRYRPSKEEINRMVAKMFDRGITGLPTRMGSWCAGHISAKELEQDIRDHSKSAGKD